MHVKLSCGLRQGLGRGEAAGAALLSAPPVQPDRLNFLLALVHIGRRAGLGLSFGACTASCFFFAAACTSAPGSCSSSRAAFSCAHWSISLLVLTRFARGSWRGMPDAVLLCCTFEPPSLS